MKRLLPFILLGLAIPAIAQTCPGILTPKLSLCSPLHGTPNWDVWVNSNWTKLDSSSTVAAPAFAVQFANPTAAAFQADPNILINPTAHSLISPILQGETLAYTTIDPAITIAAACAGANPAVYFPQGVYQTAGNIPLCTGLHLRGAGSDVTNAASGSIIQLKSSAGAVYEFLNPNASGGTGGSAQVRNVRVDGLTFDISQDSSALGALLMKGVLWSQFFGTFFYSNSNSHPVITFDGANFAGNGGNYNNDFFGVTLYDTNLSTTDTAILMTDSSSTGACSNDNHFFGGSINRYNIALKIDCGNNNSFVSQDMENTNTYGIWCTAQGSGGGACQGNWFEGSRFETNAGIGIQMDNLTGVKYNHIQRPYYSGSLTTAVDTTAANDWDHGQFSGAGNAPYQTLFNNPSSNGLQYVGINRTPTQVAADLPGFQGGLDVAGNVNIAINSIGSGGNLVVNGGSFTLNAPTATNNSVLYEPLTGETDIYYTTPSRGTGNPYYITIANSSGYTIFDSHGFNPFQALFGGGVLISAIPGGSSNISLGANNVTWGDNSASNYLRGQLNKDGSVYLNCQGTSSIFCQRFSTSATLSANESILIPDAAGTNTNMGLLYGSFTAGHSLIYQTVGGQGFIEDGGSAVGVFPATLTTTAATSDPLTVTGMTSSGHCSMSATNASAATNIATTYVSAKTTNQITVTHTATSGMTYDFLCTAN